MLHHSEILTRFYLYLDKYKNRMSRSDHNYASDSLNPFHMEGDVWTHTMMVFNYAVKKKFPIEVQFAALLHDVGKPFCRREEYSKKYERMKVSYTGHEGVSFYHTIQILSDVYSDVLTRDQIILIAKLVANHSALYTWKGANGDDSKMKVAFSGESDFLSYLSKLVYCDVMGRLGSVSLDYTDEALLDYSKYSDFVTYPHQAYEEGPIIRLLVGPPCSGKSTYCNKIEDEHPSIEVISRDDIVFEIGIGKNYSECWDSVDHSEVDSILRRRFDAAIRDRKDIVIDMTNMTKRRRRSFLNPARQAGYYTEGIVFYCGHQTIMERNSNRGGKFIPHDVIYNMERSFTYPLMDEFDNIEEIWSHN